MSIRSVSHISPEPGIFGYFAAALSLIVTIGIAVGLLVSSDFLVHFAISNQLKDAVNNNLSLEVSDTLDQFFQYEPSLATRELANIANIEITGALRAKKKMLLICRKILSLIQYRRYRLANELWYKSSTTDRNILLTSLGVSREQALNIQVFEENLQQASSLAEQISKIKADQKANNDQLKLAAQAYNLLAKDLAEAFTLTASEALSSPPSFPWYESGVLSGLPSLVELPDGISDLVSLRDLVAVKGGNILASINQQEGFYNLMEQLKIKSITLRDEVTNLIQQNNTLNSVMEESREKLIKTRGDSEIWLKRAIVALVTPEVVL